MQNPWERDWSAAPASDKMPWENDWNGAGPASEFANVQTGNSTNAGAKVTDINFENPQSAGMVERYKQLDPNAHVGVLKGLVGLPENMADLKNAAPPSLASALWNSPVNPGFPLMQGASAVKALASSLAATPGNLASGEPYRIGQGLQGILSAVPVADAATSGLGALKDALLPTKSEISPKFQQISNAVGMERINPADAELAMAKAKEIKRLGGKALTPPMRAFEAIQKPVESEFAGVSVTANPGPPTYDESMKIASLAKRLAASDTQRTPAMMQAANSQFIDALQTANRAVAERAGMGSLFDEAMREYAKAASREEAMKILVKWGKRAAAVAALGAAGKTGVDVADTLRGH